LTRLSRAMATLAHDTFLWTIFPLVAIGQAY
jgi:hypothetical protein